MSLTLWFFAVGAGVVLFAFTALVLGAIAVDADEVPGFEPRSHKFALESRPPRETRRDARPVDPEVVLPAPLGPGRLSSRPVPGPVLSGRDNQERDRILDDGIERHAWQWAERERELRGES